MPITEYDTIQVRNALPAEYSQIGQLMVDVFSKVDGFPSPAEQPSYYNVLSNVGELTKKPGTEIIVAVTRENKTLGAVVNFTDMQYYGSGGTATGETNAGGFRLLTVHSNARGKGIGKLLTLECIKRAKSNNLSQVIIHTTRAMTTAWKMYENVGFRRSEDLDFMQGELAVLGFRLRLDK